MKLGNTEVRWILKIGSVILLNSLVACGSAVDKLNPYAEGITGDALGSRDLTALKGSGSAGEDSSSRARHALEVMGSYRRTQSPQPAYPVVQPAEIRLMWVPDHLNRHGDLVPAHYYYLRVLNDRWAVEDAFELEQQLSDNSGDLSTQNHAGGNYSGAGQGGATPWVYKEE